MNQKKTCLLLIIISVVLYFDNIQEYPKGRHATGMANYYAISLGFLDSNFDFFHPKTYCLNPQYAPTKVNNGGFWNYSLQNPKGITSIDFPIHQFNIALIMDIINYNKPVVYRLYTLILSLIGLFFWERLVF